MTWALFDSAGNLVDSYDDEHEAHQALERIVADEPAAADHVAIIKFDHAGRPC